MCGLSLAWVTSENSTSTSNADILRLNFLRWTLSCLLLSPESCVDCPCPWFYANSLLSSRSAVQSPTLSQLLSPANSHSRPRDFRSKNPLSGFAPKQTKESPALAGNPYSATHRIKKWLK